MIPSNYKDILLCAVIGMWGGVALADSPTTYYIYDGVSAPKEIAESDVKGMDVDSWQIWLYPRGHNTGGLDRWGLEEGKTVEDVQRQLKNDQRFELDYAKFMGQPSDSEQFTYFNSFGPIAILSKVPKRLQKLRDVAESFAAVKERFMTIEEFWDDPNHTPFIPMGDQSKGTPFEHIGEQVKEYGERLGKIISKFRTLNSPSVVLFDSNIDDIFNSLEAAQKAGDNIQQEMSTAGVLPPPNGADSPTAPQRGATDVSSHNSLSDFVGKIVTQTSPNGVNTFTIKTYDSEKSILTISFVQENRMANSSVAKTEAFTTFPMSKVSQIFLNNDNQKDVTNVWVVCDGVEDKETITYRNGDIKQQSTALPGGSTIRFANKEMAQKFIDAVLAAWPSVQTSTPVSQ